MKRTKLLLSTVVSFLLAFVMTFAVACNNGNDDNKGNTNNGTDHGITDSSKDGLALDHISVSGYTETFELGTAFSTGNLMVIATLNDYSISDKYMTDVTLSASEYTVDSSDYNANKVGTYTIYVSHTRSNVTRTANYTVEVTPVTPAYGGIIVKIADGKSNAVSLTPDSATVTVSKDIVSVYAIGANGEAEEEPLHEDLYDADLYLGSTKIENNTTDKGGVYSLVVSLKADPTKQDFISIYVVNPVSKIEHVDGVGTYEQEASSKDEISGTWQFTVTYANGVTKTVKAGDAGLTIDIDTRTAGNGKTATVKYVEVDASGNQKEVTTTVTYTITAKEVSGDSVEYVMYYTVNTTDAEAKTGSFVTTYGGASGEDTGSNVTITNSASNFLTRQKSTSDNSVTLSDYAEIKEGGNKNVTIAVGAKATNVSVKVYVSHTSSSSARTAYLASATTAADLSKVVDSKTVGGDGNLSTNNLHALEGELDAGTTYHVFTSGSSDTMHLYQVVVTYTIVNDGGSELPDPITVTSGDLAVTSSNYTEDTAWGDSGIITILNNCSVDASSKTVDGTAIANRLKTNGGATTEKQSVKIDLSSYEGKATIRVAYRYGGTSRSLVLLSTEKSSTSNAYWTGESGGDDANSIFYVDIPVDCGTIYYLGGTNNMGIYKIVITFEAA